jgi:hypothetical protein
MIADTCDFFQSADFFAESHSVFALKTIYLLNPVIFCGVQIVVAHSLFAGEFRYNFSSPSRTLARFPLFR